MGDQLVNGVPLGMSDRCWWLGTRPPIEVYRHVTTVEDVGPGALARISQLGFRRTSQRPALASIVQAPASQRTVRVIWGIAIASANWASITID